VSIIDRYFSAALIMNVFSAKSIGLYALAIASAIGFFNLVTSYGEANIKAPKPMAGTYEIVSENLPGCLQHKTLLFNIKQSGIYLNANLTTLDGLKPAAASAPQDRSTSTTDARPTFSGRLQGQQLDLSGLVPTTICPISSQLRLSGSFAHSGDRNGQKLLGKLWLTDRNQPQGSPINFTATQQLLVPATSSH
jgi:hypothetical protein